ncbi:MAG: trypsin-like peptidase domain-containing protein [Bacillota bacterium]|nr:trypsin-like peptidase domain-containing protein [Bacillota bacterium]
MIKLKTKRRILSLFIVLTIILINCPVSFAASSEAVQAANTLKTLGLFQGAGTDLNGNTLYDLDRAPTRQEAVTMLIRLLGKENDAKAGSWNYPFTDVDSWAAPYVGYAYAHGLANGTGETTFSGSTAVSAAQYLTFVLRALGYSDSNGDFSWNCAWKLSDTLGLTDGNYNAATTSFLREDVVVISYNALLENIKGSEKSLLQSLTDTGAVKQTVASGLNIRHVKLSRSDTSSSEESSGDSSATAPAPTTGKVLTAKQISEMASPAVFYIEVYESLDDLNSDAPIASGSGFFINADGVAVTNYHVIESTSAAVITTTEGEKYRVTNIIAYDKDRDYAVIRVSKTSQSGKLKGSFPYLTMHELTSLSNGDVVYTIGSPQGLQNSISDGIVSNSKRALDDGQTYIQITAPISEGSSGGALLNEYGEVVGITCGGFVSGQNLNLAVPIDSVIGVDTSSAGNKYEDVFVNEFKKSLQENPDFANRIVDEPSSSDKVSIYSINSGDTIYGSFSTYDNIDVYSFYTPIPVNVNVIAGGLSQPGDQWQDDLAYSAYGVSWDTYILDSFYVGIDKDPATTYIDGVEKTDSAGHPYRNIDGYVLQPGRYYICTYQQINDDSAWAGRNYFLYFTMTPQNK